MPYRRLLPLAAVVFSALLACRWACAALPAQVDGQPLPSLAPMLESVIPAVVNISTHSYIREREHPLFSDPFFRYFFNLPDHRQRERRANNSLGSGVLIDAKRGYVITNNHVIDKADEITVTLHDGRQLKAELVGTDAETDVALLQVPTENLRAIALADSDHLRVGDFVVAIGNPFGLGQTVTSGIVSALGRTGLGIQGYEDFIQTDASINPGNSGGALVNLRGELVGINTAILAPNGGNVGIGFAIPVNMAKQVVDHLAQFGKVQRGVVGLQVQDLSPDLASAFGLELGKGAVVVAVETDSPAARAGLRTGDIITAVNNTRVDNATDLRNRIGLQRVGDRLNLAVLRKGEALQLHLEVAAIPSVSGAQISPYLEGGEFSEIQVDSSSGKLKTVLVSEVAENTPAWRLGLRPGDLILSVNGVAATHFSVLGELMQGNRRLLLRLLRGDSIITLLLR